jgi:excisionase family DNA binding protein
MIELNNKKYYTTKEVSQKLGLHFRTIQGWVSAGKLIPLKFGPKKFYYDEESIEKCLRGENK